MPKIRTQWGKMAAHAMIDQDLTIPDIAEKTNYKRQYVSGIIAGRYNSPIAMEKISNVLGIPFSDDVEDLGQV